MSGTDLMTNAALSRGRIHEARSEPFCLADDALYVLGGSVPVDGRISWYADEHLGRYLPFNSYLLKEEHNVLLLEAGVSATFERLAGQVRTALGSRPVLPRLAITRNEPDCVANIPRLVRQFGLNTVHSPGLMNTLQFFPADDAGPERSFNHGSTEIQMLNFGVSCEPAIAGGELRISGERVLDVIAVPLRVLPTVWYYDRATRTMFCSDSFSDETAVTADERAIAAIEPMNILVARFQKHALGKFDWLPRSDLTSVIADLERIFTRYDIDTLAPSRGMVIKGRDAVEAKIAALMAALRLF